MRQASDPAGSLRDPFIYKPGEDYYHKDFGSGRNRWGDYSKAQVDPSDDRDLWVVTEYAKARTGVDDGPTGSNSSRWGTWWARLGPAVLLGPGSAVAEGNTGTIVLSFPVTLTQALGVDATVSYIVSDGSATVADGDYSATGSPVVIPAGSLSAGIPIAIHGDHRYEPDETFTITITSAIGVRLGSPKQATVTINDDRTCRPRSPSSPNGGDRPDRRPAQRFTWLAADSSGVTGVDLMSRDEAHVHAAAARASQRRQLRLGRRPGHITCAAARDRARSERERRAT